MKKLSEVKRSNDIRYFATPDGSLEFPLNLNELNYMTPVNLQTEMYAEQTGYRQFEDVGDGFMTINDLIDAGRLVEKTYVETYCVELPKFEDRWNCPQRLPYKRIIEEFAEHGFKVTRKAIKHNYESWLSDDKSGYRDEENNVFLFTPCGCNELSFDASRLDEKLDWQETYGSEIDFLSFCE